MLLPLCARHAQQARPATHTRYDPSHNQHRSNFREYMAFDAGDAVTARARGLSPETASAIQKWLEDNADDPMPGMRKKD